MEPEEVISEGGTGDVTVMENRLDDMELRLAGMADELLRRNTETANIHAKIDLLQERQNKQEDDVRQIKDAANRMEIHFNEVMRRWDKLDERVFEMYQQQQTDNKSERKVLIDLLKYVLGGTVFAIVAFLFKGGA